MLKQQLEQDLKTALLSGDKDRATTLRGLKSVILYAEVDQGKRQEGLTDQEIIVLLAKEAKKRQESADLYIQGGNESSAAAELNEKRLIESYLPEQLNDDELAQIVDEVIAQLPEKNLQAMGKVIGSVKHRTEGVADGNRIAQMVKERLSN